MALPGYLVTNLGVGLPGYLFTNLGVGLQVFMRVVLLPEVELQADVLF